MFGYLLAIYQGSKSLACPTFCLLQNKCTRRCDSQYLFQKRGWVHTELLVLEPSGGVCRGLVRRLLVGRLRLPNKNLEITYGLLNVPDRNTKPAMQQKPWLALAHWEEGRSRTPGTLRGLSSLLTRDPGVSVVLFSPKHKMTWSSLSSGGKETMWNSIILHQWRLPSQC